MNYENFLKSKIKVAEKNGFAIDRALLHHSSKPHQLDIIEWLCERGAGLCAADTGMGKSHIAIEVLRMVIEHFGGKCLIATELGAAETFINPDPEVGEGARLGVKLDYVTNQREAFESECSIVVTNYERIRNGEFDFTGFTGVWLDEGNYLKNMASETTDMLSRQLAKVKYKFVATATPSPNETLELINYAHALGITDRGQILTRFFQRNSVKAGELTLHPQHTDDFWMWVYSWAVFIQRPSDLGYDDEGYALPALNVYWHEVKVKPMEGKVNKDGQKEMFVSGSASLPDAAKVKRASIDARLKAAVEVMEQDESDNLEHWIIWHHLEDERKALNKEFKNHPSYADVFGALHWKEKERRIVNFSKGELDILATKPEISGVGCNFQKHCYKNILLGINHSFDEFYQLIKRTHRYGQTMPVEVHVFYTLEEYEIVQNLKRKWEEHDIARATMRDIVLQYGLNQSKFVEERKRTFADNRIIYTGKNFTLVNADAVHDDLRTAFSKLHVHFAIISEQVVVPKNSDMSIDDILSDETMKEIIEAMGVSEFKISGSGSNEGVQLVGTKVLSTGEVLTLKTPTRKWEDEQHPYQFVEELSQAIEALKFEILLFMHGKHAPDKQPELPLEVLEEVAEEA